MPPYVSTACSHGGDRDECRSVRTDFCSEVWVVPAGQSAEKNACLLVYSGSKSVRRHQEFLLVRYAGLSGEAGGERGSTQHCRPCSANWQLCKNRSRICSKHHQCNGPKRLWKTGNQECFLSLKVKFCLLAVLSWEFLQACLLKAC